MPGELDSYKTRRDFPPEPAGIHRSAPRRPEGMWGGPNPWPTGRRPAAAGPGR